MLNDLSNTQIENLIDEWIRNSRNRQIAKSRFLDGLTYERLSEIYELSVNQTKNIVQSVKEVLLRHLPQEKGGAV
jgi:DNA-directed RNA polymerase specialized sigma24 family protein